MEKMVNNTTSNFKKYYDNPEWRKKYQAYLKERIPCECGQMVQRVSIARHRRTKKHSNKVKNIQQTKKQTEYDKLTHKLEKLEKMVQKLIK
jgi:hypothetical protein